MHPQRAAGFVVDAQHGHLPKAHQQGPARLASKPAIFHARERLGPKPLAMLFECGCEAVGDDHVVLKVAGHDPSWHALSEGHCGPGP